MKEPVKEIEEELDKNLLNKLKNSKKIQKNFFFIFK